MAWHLALGIRQRRATHDVRRPAKIGRRATHDVRRPAKIGRRATHDVRRPAKIEGVPRVVLITDRFPVPSETFIVQRFVRLLDRGWDIHVFCTESTAEDRAMFPEIVDRPDVRARIHERPRSRRRLVALALLPFVIARTFARAPLATARYLREGWRELRWTILRTMYFDHPLITLSPDVVHFTFGWFAPDRMYLGPALGVRLVASFQGADLNYGGLEVPGYYDGVWRGASLIHFLGEDLRRRAAARGFAPDGRDVVIVPGVDFSVFEPSPRDRAPDEPLRILSVGRLHWKKGYEYALLAIRALIDLGIDLRYRIIGDGPGREAVVYAIHDLGLGDVVTLLGAEPASRVRDEMQWADVLLHAATSEGFCYAVVEAQAMQLPVVTSDADGLPENVEHGLSGLVVPRRDPQATADALSTLARDAELRRRMGDAGRARVMDLLAVAREIDEFEAFYRRVLAGTAPEDGSRFGIRTPMPPNG